MERFFRERDGNETNPSGKRGKSGCDSVTGLLYQPPMADFLTALNSAPLLTDGAMGSYLFELTGRLPEANHVYEAFNADQPELIRRVHRDHLTAGARCLKTNTFGANRRQLQSFGLEHRVAELNRVRRRCPCCPTSEPPPGSGR
ncbi:MAG: homocysteine S-methyltransferase family protein [Verrucomicrobiota bacterium]|jgi:hypothetical protein